MKKNNNDSTPLHSRILDKYCKFYSVIELTFIPVYLITILIHMYVSYSVYLFLLLIHIILFLVASPFQEKWKQSLKYLWVSTAVMLCVLPFQLSYHIELYTQKSLPTLILFVFSLTLGIMTILIFKSGNSKVEDIVSKYNLSVIKKFSVYDYDNDEEYGLTICKDEETGEMVRMDADSRYVHVFVDGPTGCGKTSLALVPMIKQDIEKGHGVICIEPKQDLAEKCYAMCVLNNRPGIYFDPTSPYCPRFNPFAGKEEEVIETTTTVFLMLAPDSKTYFRDITTNLLRKALMTLKRIEAAYMNYETGISSRPTTLIELNDLICNTNGKGVALVNELVTLPVISDSEAKQNQDTKSWFLNEYFSDRSKVYDNASGVRMQVANLIQNKHLRRILNPENGVSDIDFDKILAEGGCLFISTALGTLRELGSYLGYFIIFNLQSSIFRRPGNEYTRKPSFLYIDEAQKYLNAGFSDILTMGRSYRVAVTLASQSRELLVENAGEKLRALLSNTSSNLRNTILFPGICYEDARFYSQAFGNVLTTEVRTGETEQKFSIASAFAGQTRPGTVSKQVSEKETAEFSISDLTYQDFNHITYRILKNKTLQRARRGVVNWIDKSIDNSLNDIVTQYKKEVGLKTQQEEQAEMQKRQELYENFQKNILSSPTSPNHQASNTGMNMGKKKASSFAAKKSQNGSKNGSNDGIPDIKFPDSGLIDSEIEQLINDDELWK